MNGPIDDKSLAKVPWKKVAEHIKQRGGFLFGSYTCKKKYLDLLQHTRRASTAQKRKPNEPY